MSGCLRLVLLAFSMVWSASSFTSELDGQYQIVVSGSDGGELALGQVAIENAQLTIDLIEEPFSNHFLSMRPFRCMDLERQMWCHLPYPYEKPNAVSVEDLRSLEYEFLFIHRSATDYGIDAWNGLYFLMSVSDGDISGAIREVDLNILASPPEKGVVWPITSDDLHESEPDRHQFNQIRFVRQ